VKEEGADDTWESFPHVREVLAEWGLMDARGSPADIESKLGVRVAKIEIKDRDVVDGISQFFLTHRPDLLVVATHGRRGVNRWLNGSVSEDVARRTHVPTLLIGPDGHGFIDARSGRHEPSAHSRSGDADAIAGPRDREARLVAVGGGSDTGVL
ncbi:MAG: universal stress protein, partial [Hyphomicrobium sp.]